MGFPSCSKKCFSLKCSSAPAGDIKEDLATRPARKHGLILPFDPLQVIAWVVFPMFIVLFFVFVGLYVRHPFNYLVCIWWGVLALVSITLYIWCMFSDASDPGIRVKVDEDDFNTPEGKTACCVCKAWVDKSSKHCRKCNKCVIGFDHHCKWLNNCVGVRNYRLFFTFLSMTLSTATFQLAVVIFLFIDSFFAEHHYIDHMIGLNGSIVGYRVAIAITGFLGVITVGLLAHLWGFHVMLYFRKMSTYDWIIEKRERLKQKQLALEQETQMSNGGGATKNSARPKVASMTDDSGEVRGVPMTLKVQPNGENGMEKGPVTISGSDDTGGEDGAQPRASLLPAQSKELVHQFISANSGMVAHEDSLDQALINRDVEKDLETRNGPPTPDAHPFSAPGTYANEDVATGLPVGNRKKDRSLEPSPHGNAALAPHTYPSTIRSPANQHGPTGVEVFTHHNATVTPGSGQQQPRTLPLLPYQPAMPTPAMSPPQPPADVIIGSPEKEIGETAFPPRQHTGTLRRSSLVTGDHTSVGIDHGLSHTTTTTTTTTPRGLLHPVSQLSEAMLQPCNDAVAAVFVDADAVLSPTSSPTPLPPAPPPPPPPASTPPGGFHQPSHIHHPSHGRGGGGPMEHTDSGITLQSAGFAQLHMPLPDSPLRKLSGFSDHSRHPTTNKFVST